MPMAKLALKPGVVSVASQLLAEGTWWSSTLIRFFMGYVQKLGGWARLSSQTLVGTCRGMHAWADLLGNYYLGAGTEQRLEVFYGGNIYDITPIRATSNISPAFTTTSTSRNVTVADTANGASQGDWISLPVPVSVGGLILQGFYLIQSSTDANDYVIEAASAASGSVSGGGAVPLFTTTNTSAHVEVTLNNHGLAAGALFGVQVSTTVGGITIAVGAYNVLASPAPTTNTFYIQPGGTATSGASVSENSGHARIEYLLPSGYAANTALTGYGIGPYGAGAYGIGGSGSIVAPLRHWSLDNWGELLIGNPTNGAVYTWTPPNVSTPAVVVGTAPAMSWSSFVIAQVQCLVLLGTESGGTQYPNLVAWSDVGDYTDFTPSVSNQAGSFQIPSGSKIVCGIAVGLGALIWTDVDVWSMVYQGLPFVFAFNRIAVNCETLSSRSVAVIGNIIMWPSIRGFFQYSGTGVNFFPCPVWDFFFANVDYTQTDQVFAAVNTTFNEVAWFFPFSASSTYYSTATPYGYVKYNSLDGVWDFGVSSQYQRTAWVDHFGDGEPVGADTAGLLQQHEISPDADGLPLMWSITSGYEDIQQGEEYGFIDFFIPDQVATPSTAQMNVTFTATNYPGDAPLTYGPYAFTPTTEFLTPGLRARQIAVTFSGADLGSSVRLGAHRYRIQADGRN